MKRIKWKGKSCSVVWIIDEEKQFLFFHVSMHDYAFRSSVATRLLMSIKREFLVYYKNESKFLLNSGKIVLCMCSKWCSIGKIKIMYSLSVSQRISLHWPLFLAVCERSFAQRKTVFVSFDLWLMCCHISYHHIKMDPFFPAILLILMLYISHRKTQHFL